MWYLYHNFYDYKQICFVSFQKLQKIPIKFVNFSIMAFFYVVWRAEILAREPNGFQKCKIQTFFIFKDAIASKYIKKPYIYLNLKFSLKFDIYANTLKISRKILSKNAWYITNLRLKDFLKFHPGSHHATESFLF